MLRLSTLPITQWPPRPLYRSKFARGGSHKSGDEARTCFEQHGSRRCVVICGRRKSCGLVAAASPGAARYCWQQDELSRLVPFHRHASVEQHTFLALCIAVAAIYTAYRARTTVRENEAHPEPSRAEIMGRGAYDTTGYATILSCRVLTVIY